MENSIQYTYKHSNFVSFTQLFVLYNCININFNYVNVGKMKKKKLLRLDYF